MVALLTVFLIVATLARIPVRSDALRATGRAIVQFLVVAVVIAWIFAHPQWAVAYLAVMLVAAAWTAGRRIRWPWRSTAALAAVIAAGAAVPVAAVLGVGALPLEAAAVLPFAAQMIGSAMAAVAVTGLRMRDEAHERWGEVEGWLALGAPPRLAVIDLGRRAVARALVPALDQTRSAGLVTLPGAFVGLLLGGASPLEAARIQVLVLVGILAAQAVAAVLTLRLLAPRFGAVRPDAG
ncbi:MAG: ABC transporter permease [Microbacteriaceae bacterium]